VKILFVTTKSPYPLFEGRALRTYNLIKQAAQQHEVHLVSYVQDQQDLDGIEHMRTLCPVVEFEPLYLSFKPAKIIRDALIELFSVRPLPIVKYATAAMRARIRRLVAQHGYDLVHLDMLHLGDYVEEFAGIPVVLGEHNVESVILQRRAENETSRFKQWYFSYQYRKLEAYEARCCQRVSRVTAVSEHDAQGLAQLSGRKDVEVIPNGVDTDYFAISSPQPDPFNLVFVGGFTWFPNQDAIQYFCSDILPLIRAEIPEVTVTIIGKQPDNAIVRAIAAEQGVHLTGLVDDIRPHVARAAAYIVPLRIGGGTRLKILDALSMSKAIVSTSIGCEGLAVQHGHNILIGDGPRDFAQQVVAVLRDPDLARRVGAQGRELAVGRYDWRAIGAQMLRLYEGLVGGVATASKVKKGGRRW
jgi:sugar transferase (PEP-CTERM/EpsH1 system associated)